MSHVLPGEDLSLRHVLPSVSHHLGVPQFEQDRLGLPSARAYVVVLVDGLGWEILTRSLMDAPYISEVFGDAIKVSAGVPTTTCVSLMTLWTGDTAGAHGVMGYTFRPDRPRDASAKHPGLVSLLDAEKPLVTIPNVFDTCVDAGVNVTWVVPGEHIGSGLTLMGTRQASMIGVDDPDAPARIEAVCAATQGTGPALVYVYEYRLDQAGHGNGVKSRRWHSTLARIDEFLGHLRESLDPDVCLLVTGDHGMVDTPQESRIVIESTPGLATDIDLIGGEARFRHLYTSDPERVARRWADTLGDKAQVLTRDDAIDQGLFGTVSPQWKSRIGDVIAIAQGEYALLTDTFPIEFRLVGMHGALTPAEKYVPVLIDMG